MYFRPLSTKIHAPPVSWASCLTFTKKQKGPVKQWSMLGVGFSADLRESAGTVAKTPPRGFSHPLCLLSSVPFDPCSTGHSSASSQKTTPKNVYLHLGPKWFQSPTTWLDVPCVLPSIAGVSVGKDWWYPVLTLYLWVAALNSLFLGNTKHRVSSLSVLILSCPWVGFDPFAYLVAWDVFSCRKTELCLPNLSPVTISP